MSSEKEKEVLFHEIDGLYDKVTNNMTYEEDVNKLKLLKMYMEHAADGTYEELMAVAGCFPVIPDAYSKLNKIDIFITVDKLAQLITAANDVSNLNMIEEHALQIVDAVRREREKCENSGDNLVIDQSLNSRLESPGYEFVCNSAGSVCTDPANWPPRP